MLRTTPREEARSPPLIRPDRPGRGGVMIDRETAVKLADAGIADLITFQRDTLARA